MENAMHECQGEIDLDAECPTFEGFKINAIRIVCTFNFILNKKDNHDSGILEVFHEGRWGAVCFSNINSNYAASLACNHLGYSNGVHVQSPAFEENTGCGQRVFGSGIWMDNVTCFGNKTNLLNCSKGPIGLHTCNDCLIAYIQCWNELKLVGRSPEILNQSSGLVQTKFRGTWESMCAKRFDDQAASVICRELGFSQGRQIQNSNVSTTKNILSTSPSSLVYIKCNGNESLISQCSNEM